MRGVLIAFVLVGLLVAGLIAWLELDGDSGPSARLPGAPPADRAELPQGDDGEDGKPEAVGDEGADGDDAHPLLAQLPEPAIGPLPAEPKPALLEPGVEGRIPRIGDDGTLPWRAYAKPFANPAGKPVVAVLVTNLGLKRDVTALAVDGLPGGVSLVFSPYAPDLESWAARARAAGHETLVAIPQEPAAFPANDPGGKALLTGMAASELSLRLRWSLSRFAGYVGAAGFMGERFVASTAAVRPMIEELGARGLMYADTTTTPDSKVPDVARELNLPVAAVAVKVDTTLAPGAIDAKLGEAVALAKREGHAVALAEPYPVSIERIALWAETLEDVVLAPVSATARPQPTE